MKTETKTLTAEDVKNIIYHSKINNINTTQVIAWIKAKILTIEEIKDWILQNIYKKNDE